MRLRLIDLRLSRLPRVIGACAADAARIAEYGNSAENQLLMAKEAGEESWFGTWAEISFGVSRSNPYVTLPRQIARLESVNICNRPIPVNNQFVEYLQFGNGRFPKNFSGSLSCGQPLQVYSRNNAVTFTDLTTPPQLLVAYIGDAADVGKRILFQGLDNNNVTVYSQDGFNRVIGIFLTFESPFVSSPFPFNRLLGIQKDVTNAPVQIFQMDPSTGAQVLLLTMEPGETTANYRRYYMNPLPLTCCHTIPSSPETVQVTAIAKLEHIPVQYDTDYFVIQNLEAMIEQCSSIRYSEVDTTEAKAMSSERHKQAIRMLNGELTHRLGLNEPAVIFRPFGSARLSRQKIGSML